MRYGTFGALLFVTGCIAVQSAPPPDPPPFRFTIHDAGNDFTAIGDTITPDEDIQALIAPYRSRMEDRMVQVLGRATGTFVKADPEGTLDNLVADALFHVVQELASDTVHVALLNDGGLRVPVASGPILMRHAYELLPFENFVTVLSLSGVQLERLADEIARSGGEPIAGWTLVLDGADATNVRVGGEPIDPVRTYRLATVDYLVDGGGTWSVLWEPGEAPREDLRILIRDVFVRYLRRQDVWTPTLDGRIRRTGGGGAEGDAQ